MTRRCNTFAKRGFTLLEVLLSLTLVGIVLLILGTMIHIHLRVVEGSRTDLQDARLAHSLLKRIGDDLRGTIRYEPVDTSGMNFTAKTFTQAAAIATAKANGGSSSGTSTDGSSTGGSAGSGQSTSGSGGTSSGATGGAASGTSGTGGTGSSKSGSGSTSGGSTSNGGSSAGGSSSTTGSSSTSSSSSSTQSTTPPVTPAIPGLYGDQYSLQIDVARLPRLDEYTGQVSSDGSQLVPPSDVKSISYYLGSSGGLMKQELHRAAALYAEENGGEGMLSQEAQALAPEVSDVTFSYFDGTAMQSSWDSTEQGGLPIAVQIELAIPAGASAGKPDNQDVRIYTMLVQLENGGLSPTVPDPSTSSSSDSSSQPSASGDSSGSGTDGSGSSSSGDKSGGTSGASRTGKRGAASTGQGEQGGATGKGGGQGGASGKGAGGQGGTSGKGGGQSGGTSGKTGSGSGTTSPASQQFKAAGPSSGGASGASGAGAATGGGSPSQGVAPGGAN